MNLGPMEHYLRGSSISDDRALSVYPFVVFGRKIPHHPFGYGKLAL